jgi:integrase
VDGKTYWLGEYGSVAAQAEYDRLVSTLLGTPGVQAELDQRVSLLMKNTTREVSVSIPKKRVPVPVKKITVKDLITGFLRWSETYYRDVDGKPTREHQNFLNVLRPLQKRFGATPIAEFGPKRLLEFRQDLVQRNLARRTVNAMIRRVRQVFRFGVSRELCSIDALSRLKTLEPLQPNRGGRETSGSRGSVEFSLIEKTLPHLSPLLQSFVTVAYFTGCRVSELAKLTTGQIEMTSSPWVANLDKHKTAHQGKSRKIYFGPRAQEALSPWLLPQDPNAVIYSPLRADDRQAKRKGKNLPGQVYGRSSLQQALQRAIKKAGLPASCWSLGQLRHSCATNVANEFGLESCRQILSHSSTRMSSHYAADADLAARTAAQTIG